MQLLITCHCSAPWFEGICNAAGVMNACGVSTQLLHCPGCCGCYAYVMAHGSLRSGHAKYIAAINSSCSGLLSWRVC